MTGFIALWEGYIFDWFRPTFSRREWKVYDFYGSIPSLPRLISHYIYRCSGSLLQGWISPPGAAEKRMSTPELDRLVPVAAQFLCGWIRTPAIATTIAPIDRRCEPEQASLQ